MDESTLETDQLNEYRKIQRSFRIVAGIALLVLCGGSIFFHAVEHLSWLNAFYFCTITLTTIGYGDITPQTNAGKLFDIFYVIVGIGIIATFANLLIRNAFARRQIKQLEKRR